MGGKGGRVALLIELMDKGENFKMIGAGALSFSPPVSLTYVPPPPPGFRPSSDHLARLRLLHVDPRLPIQAHAQQVPQDARQRRGGRTTRLDRGGD